MRKEKKITQYPVSLSRLSWLLLPAEYKNKYFWFYNFFGDCFTAYVKDIEEVNILVYIAGKTYDKYMEELNEKTKRRKKERR